MRSLTDRIASILTLTASAPGRPNRQKLLSGSMISWRLRLVCPLGSTGLSNSPDNYRELATFSHKLRFLLDIQISIFDLFHERLASALSAYLARTSTIGRASREDQAMLQGIGGLERLCKVFGSAEYLERAMRDWNDDVVCPL